MEALESRFWDKVDKSGDCWNWTASKIWNGYGCIKVGGVSRRSHRVSYELEHGEIPDGLCVCHKCDNRACVNPDHLFLGTQADNMRDMIDKGRSKNLQMPGEKNVNAKLSEFDVLGIRAEYSAGKTSYRKLSTKYAISRAQIYSIIKRKKWTHI